MNMENRIVFKKVSATEWTTIRPVRGYTASIVLTPVPAQVTLTINPGNVVTIHATLGRAKGQFRKHLSTVPVTG